MRIALVTPGFSAHDDDWCIPALQDAARVLSDQHDVRVFSITYPHRADDYLVKGIRVTSLGDGKPGLIPHARRLIRTVRAVGTAHRERPFDVVHGFWADQGGVVANIAARRLGIGDIVVTVMAGELTYDAAIAYGKRMRPIAGRLARWSARGASALIVNSKYHAERIAREQPGLRPRRLPFGCDTQRFSPRGPAKSLQGDIPVLCVGTFVPVKGHATVLAAFASVAAGNRALHLHLVGDGCLARFLQRQASELGIADRVTFHGHVEHDELPAYYRGAAFCVLGSFFESLGMVVLEAAACGRVTVGSSVGSMPEVGEPALLNEPGSSDALATCLEKAATNSALRTDAARRAEATVRGQYELVHARAGLERLYAETTANVAGSR